MSLTSINQEFPLPAELCARFRVLAQVGVGGHASVFSAVDRCDPGSRFAIKILHQPVLDLDRRRRFERECDALRRLSAATSVIEIIDAGVDAASGRAFVVTPLYAGTLADRLASLGRLPVDEVLVVGVAIAEALDHTHAVGIVHRDVKPSNIFIDGDGGVVLGDFGAAQLLDDLTLSSSMAMSVAYAAPETVEQGATSVASDLYGLGITLYQLLTGRLPFSTAGSGVGEQSIATLVNRVVAERPAPIASSDVPLGVTEVVGRLLEKDPADRFESAAEVARALDAARTDPCTPVEARRSRMGARVAALCVASVACLGIGAAAVVSALDDGVDEPDAIDTARSSVTPLGGSPTDAPLSSPIESPSASSRSVATSPCGTGMHLLCEDFESGVSDWFSMRDAEVATLEVIEVDAVSGTRALELVPGAGTTRRSSFLRTEVEVPQGVPALSAVVHVNFDIDGASDDWVTNVITLSGPDQRFWVVQASPSPDGRIGFRVQSWKDGEQLVAVSDRSFDPGNWHCIRMTVTPDAESLMTLDVDDERVASIDAIPTDTTVSGTLVVAAGGSWWSSSGETPSFLTDDLIVSLDEPGCS